MAALTVTCDENANFKLLRRLEVDGYIEIHATSIERITPNRKATNKHLPTAILDSPFSVLDGCVIAEDDTPLHAIRDIIGAEHKGDVVHLEAHLRDRRDVFVTDDNDFLSMREELESRFGMTIKTTAELLAMFDHGGSS
ncbi:MAG: hypothetical protein HWE35_15640 [Rhodobacteraceae bacterium]|nr:hypothetical protein [Paracoccaceae bacterium]